MNHIRVERVKKGLNQTQVAEMLGISQTMWSMVESGDRPPTGNIRELLESWDIPDEEMAVMCHPKTWQVFSSGFVAAGGGIKKAKTKFLKYMNK